MKALASYSIVIIYSQALLLFVRWKFQVTGVLYAFVSSVIWKNQLLEQSGSSFGEEWVAPSLLSRTEQIACFAWYMIDFKVSDFCVGFSVTQKSGQLNDLSASTYVKNMPGGKEYNTVDMVVFL